MRKLKPDNKLKNFEQGAFGYPLFETMAWQTTYFWKENPYFVKYQGNSSFVSFSADYLLIYWMAKSANLVDENE